MEALHVVVRPHGLSSTYIQFITVILENILERRVRQLPGELTREQHEGGAEGDLREQGALERPVAPLQAGPDDLDGDVGLQRVRQQDADADADLDHLAEPGPQHGLSIVCTRRGI